MTVPRTPAPGAEPPADEPRGTGRPHVRVVRGVPDDVELAALVAGLVAAAADEDATPEGTTRSAWTDRARSLRGRTPLSHGGDAWRWSLHG